ncbi:hypothetical protein Tco_1340780, partial [Tanacetum coccineum]
ETGNLLATTSNRCVNIPTSGFSHPSRAAEALQDIVPQNELPLEAFESTLHHPPKSTTSRMDGAISSLTCDIATGSAKESFKF